MIYKDRNIYRKNKSFKILIVAEFVENSLQRLRRMLMKEKILNIDTTKKY